MSSIITNKTFWVYLIASLLLTGSFFWFYHFPKAIDLQYPAVEFRDGDPSSTEQTTVTIRGTLYHPFFRNEYFKGDFAVEKYDFTQKHHLFDIDFGFGLLNDHGLEDGEAFLESLGGISKTGSFGKLEILVSESVPNTDGKKQRI